MSPRRSAPPRPDAPIRVMIVEPRRLLGIGVHDVFDRARGIDVVAHVRSPDEALLLSRQAAPDVILLDTVLSDPSSAEAARRLRREMPNSAVIVLGGDDDANLLAATTLGAVAHLAEIAVPDDLVRLVRRVAHGARPLNDEVSARPQLVGPILDSIRETILVEHSSTSLLTAREMTILRLVAQGLRNRDIAARLGVSEQTVKNHLSAIFHKLGVPNRTRAVTYAARQGWLGAEVESDQSDL